MKLPVLSSNKIFKFPWKLPQMSPFIAKSFLGHSTSINHRNFSPAAGFYWPKKLPASKYIEKSASDVNLYYQIVSKPFYEHKSSKFFACGGHLLAHKTTSTALNSQFQSSLKKTASDVNLYYKIISRPFYDTNHRNFSPAAKVSNEIFSGLHETLSFVQAWSNICLLLNRV